MRLIAGHQRGDADAPLRAGIEIRIASGWKTYWRYPGDSGIPPRFDFSASANVGDVTVLWPAPIRFSDGSGMSIGYAERVIFPLRVTPADPRAPVVLRLKLDYAVCEKLCLPVDATAELDLAASGGAHEAALAASEARVPKAAKLGADGALVIAAVRRETGAKPRVIVDVKTADVGSADLFAEGPTAEWALPLPGLIGGAPPGVARFAFELDGLPPGAKPENFDLRLTAVTPARAIETLVHLD